MRIGDFKIAKQIGQKGYYGRVVIEMEPRSDGEVTIDFDQHRASRWQSGVRFGIDYALEHVSPAKIDANGAKVRVMVVEGHDVDTILSLIACIAARAMFQAMGVEPPAESPSVDFERGLVRFAK